VARVKTYGDVLAEYRVHRESESLGPDGQLCARLTRGLLQRRAVSTAAVLTTYIGMEANRLEDVQAGLVHDLGDVLSEYQDPERAYWNVVVLPALKKIPRRQLADAIGMSERQIAAIRNGHAMPTAEHRLALTKTVERNWFPLCLSGCGQKN
jgi:hypothetical protein